MTTHNQDEAFCKALTILKSNDYFQHLNYNLLMSMADAMQQECNCQDGEYLFLVQQAQKQLTGDFNAN